jgi:hypothetical protein
MIVFLLRIIKNLLVQHVQDSRTVFGVAACDSRSNLLPLAQQPNAGQGRLMLEVSRAHTVTHHSL